MICKICIILSILYILCSPVNSFRSGFLFWRRAGPVQRYPLHESVTSSLNTNQALSQNHHRNKCGFTIIIFGGSGDLAINKLLPALCKLIEDNILRNDVKIVCCGRSNYDTESFHEKLLPLLTRILSKNVINNSPLLFLQKHIRYSRVYYDDIDEFRTLNEYLSLIENDRTHTFHRRLFYLAIPPSQFYNTLSNIYRSGLVDNTYKDTIPSMTVPTNNIIISNNIIKSDIMIEKPIGKDMASCMDIITIANQLKSLARVWYVDHYLQKDLVKKILPFRKHIPSFRYWNNSDIHHVEVSFKDRKGVEGRGGYFDEYGIVRDIIQNHLLQILSHVVMDIPDESIQDVGSSSARHNYNHNQSVSNTSVDRNTHHDNDNINNHNNKSFDSAKESKLQLFRSILPIHPADIVLGQYEGYYPESKLAEVSSTPTYASCVLYINNTRWYGVPFVLTAGKALEESESAIRVYFKKGVRLDLNFMRKGSPSQTYDKCDESHSLCFRIQPNQVRARAR